MAELNQKEKSFLRVHSLLITELHNNMETQKALSKAGISFEGTELEKEFVKLDTRFRHQYFHNLHTKWLMD